jgi:IS4 transposase
MILSIQESDWPSVVSRLGEAIDIEESVRTSGVLRRRRQVRSGSDLLRLALAYGPGGQSLRETAAWADLQQLASLSDVALMYRLRDAADWLGQVAGGLLARRAVEPLAASGGPGLRLRVVDGSVISAPGKGPGWRLHAVYDVAEQRFSQLELTSRHTAEALERAKAEPGELRLADRVYARPGGLHHLIEGGGDFLVRVGRRSLTLTHADGAAFDLAAALGESERTGSCDLPVLVLDGRDRGRAPLPARLVLLKKPPEAAERARKLALRESQRGGHKNDPLSLHAAGHLMLITSLAPDPASPDQLGALYRLRWQIELAFKRLKSLLHIDRLPAKDKNLARAWIFAHLIAALLIEDLSPEFRDSPP